MILMQDILKDIMAHIPETRANDLALYAHYIDLTRPDIAHIDMFELFTNADKYDLPSFETVSRTKRRILRDNKQPAVEDRITEYTVIKNNEGEMEYTIYSNSSD